MEKDTHMSVSSLGKRDRDTDGDIKWALVKTTPLKVGVRRVAVIRPHTDPTGGAEGFRIRDIATGFEGWVPSDEIFDTEAEANTALAARDTHRASTAQEHTQPAEGPAGALNWSNGFHCGGKTPARSETTETVSA